MPPTSSFCPNCKSALPVAGTANCPVCSGTISGPPRRTAKGGGKSAYPKARPFNPPPARTDAAGGQGGVPAAAIAGGALIVLLLLGIGWLVWVSPWHTTEPIAQVPVPAEEGGLDLLPPAPPGTEKEKPIPPKEKPDDGIKNKPPETPLVPPSTGPEKPVPMTPPKEQPGPRPPQETPPSIPPKESPKTDPPVPPKVDPPMKDPPVLVPTLPPGQKPVVLLPLEPLNPDQNPTLIPPLAKSDLKFDVFNFKVETKGKGLQLAVTTAGWDNLGGLLTKLGRGYTHTNLKVQDLVDLTKLSQYDVIFINCSNDPVLYNDPRIYSNLRAYVQKGGIIYASDLRFDDLAKIFPDYVVSRQGIKDLQGNVTAAVVDEGLKRVLGPQVNLHFDFQHRPAAFNPQKAKIYLMTYQKNFITGQMVGVPLLTKFALGKGQVVYTSFHNSTQLSDVESKLLWSIIFATVNAQAEVKAWQTMIEKGYNAKEMKNLALSQGYSLARQTFKHDAKGKLAVSLGFRDDGAKLQLKLTAPDGKILQHTDTSSFLLEIDEAPAGNWQYSVTALEAPYDNFPFSLIIGQPK